MLFRNSPGIINSSIWKARISTTYIQRSMLLLSSTPVYQNEHTVRHIAGSTRFDVINRTYIVKHTIASLMM